MTPPLEITKPKSGGFAAPWSFILRWRKERKHLMASWPAPAVRQLHLGIKTAHLKPSGLYSACVLSPDQEWFLIASTECFDMATLRKDIVTLPALFNTVPAVRGNKVHLLRAVR